MFFANRNRSCPKGKEGCKGQSIELCRIKQSIDKAGAFRVIRVSSGGNNIPKRIARQFYDSWCTKGLLFTFITSIGSALLVIAEPPFLFELFKKTFDDNSIVPQKYISLLALALISLSVLVAFILACVFNSIRMEDLERRISKAHLVFLDSVGDRLLTIKNKDNINEDYIKGTLDFFAQSITTFFKHSLPNKEIGCAIRIYTSKNKVGCYKTYGRSGLSRNRGRTSQPILADSGIPKLFNSTGRDAVVLCNDHQHALCCPVLIQKNGNHEHYIDEENSIITAPIINVSKSDLNETGVLGILFVTSTLKNSFNLNHVDSVRFLADAIAFFTNEVSDSFFITDGDQNEI